MMRFLKIIWQSIRELVNDGCISSAAAMAYYAIFALPPIAMIVFQVVGYLGISEERINESIKKRMGIPVSAQQSSGAESSRDASEASRSTESISLGTVAQRTESQRVGRISTVSGIVGCVVLIFTATGLFSELQVALNRAWGVTPNKNRSRIKRFFVKRLLSLGLILLIALLLLGSVVLTTTLDIVYENVRGALPSLVSQAVRFVISNIVSILIVTPLFAAVFKYLPDADMRWRDVWIGALATAILFDVGKAMISWYLLRADLGASWGGATTSIIAVLAWIYYTSLMVLYGAELTQLWARKFGQGFHPQAGAIQTAEHKAQPA